MDPSSHLVKQPLKAGWLSIAVSDLAADQQAKFALTSVFVFGNLNTAIDSIEIISWQLKALSKDCAV